jgi:lipopolysaccharide transport system ATP-binding protein
MSEIAIRAQGLGKLYRIGQRERENALRNVLGPMLRAPWKLFRREKKETFWALKDVELEVEHGEVLGLIGRNGAGKTTLLKILSRITRPTLGWAEIYGRVGSLLEVGTGFHPELSGRDNIYLSGAILGMSKREIERKFDEIVAFAEIEKFIDMPVKHYSSGMYVRLAFAVAAHLDPEILLVDEVLAVGDINFQKKCLGKMGDVAREGRTIVLVSHQMNQMRRLCHRVVWVDDGSIRKSGKTHDVVSAYESAMARGESDRDSVKPLARSFSKARFLKWEIMEPASEPSHTLLSAGPVTVSFTVELAEPVLKAQHGVALFNTDRQLMWANANNNLALEPGVHVLSVSFPSLPLRPGMYQWQVSFWDEHDMLDLWDCLPEMNIATDVQQHPSDKWNGILNLPSQFSVEDDRTPGPRPSSTALDAGSWRG